MDKARRLLMATIRLVHRLGNIYEPPPEVRVWLPVTDIDAGLASCPGYPSQMIVCVRWFTLYYAPVCGLGASFIIRSTDLSVEASFHVGKNHQSSSELVDKLISALAPDVWRAVCCWVVAAVRHWCANYQQLNPTPDRYRYDWRFQCLLVPPDEEGELALTVREREDILSRYVVVSRLDELVPPKWRDLGRLQREGNEANP